MLRLSYGVFTWSIEWDSMRFCQLSQITLLEPGIRIEAVRTLGQDEDYLRDHFPRFAVLPGVLMLEALFQASALLVRATDDYRHGLVLLREAKNVKFANFVQPGQSLHVACEIVKQDGESTLLKASGTKDGEVAVSGRLLVVHQPIRGGGKLCPADNHAGKFFKNLVDRLQRVPVAS